jgi:RHS repeat-associated protein
VRSPMWLAIASVCVLSGSLSGCGGTTSAGRTVGSFSVSPTGAATYSIPIWVPPGPRGIQPNLAITYNSQSRDGTLGPGWGLGGFSAIARCRQSVAQDGAAAPVTLTNSDRFCLDGKRLRLTSSDNLSTYGAASTTYQTEIADFSNVTASAALTGNGPAYFTLQAKNGLIYEYGNTATSGAPSGGNGSQVIPSSSSTVVQWLLDKVSDRYGNNYVITYGSVNGSVGAGLPTQISYTPSSAGSTTYNYTVTFAYETRTTQNSSTNKTAITGFPATLAVNNPNLLTGITVASSGTTVHQYNFAYTASTTTTRALLTSITECAGSSGTDCLAPTTISYQSGTIGAASPSNSTGTASSLDTPLAVDIDGDGRADFLYSSPSGTGGSELTWWVQFATASGFTAPVNTGITTTDSNGLVVDDFLGDGSREILAPNGGVWYAYKWNGSSFTATSTGISVVTTAFNFTSADAFGNGLADLFWVSGGTLFELVNTSSSGTISFASSANTALTGLCSSGQLYGNFSFAGSPVKHLDFNGDGREDLEVLCSGSSPFAQTLISQGSTYAVGITISGGLGLPLNWNDDACTDLLLGGSSNTVYISGCNGGSATSFNLPSGLNVAAALDWDGDGRTDLLTIPSNSSGSDYSVYLSTGTGVSAPISTSIPSNFGSSMVFDQNGDGLDDLAFFAGFLDGGGVTYGLHNGASSPPDLVSKITDGFGNYVSPTYVSIVQSNYTANQFNNTVAYPYNNAPFPLYVVSQATFNDPTSTSSGTYYESFAYNGTSTNLQGRGFSNFLGIEQFDSRSGIWDLQGRNGNFPFTGWLNSHFQSTAQITSVNYSSPNQSPNQSGAMFFASQPNFDAETLDGTTNNQRYFINYSNRITNLYEAGGSENGDLIRTISDTYTYDNGATTPVAGNLTTLARTTTDNDSNSPYSNQSWTSTVTKAYSPDTSSNWCLDMPTQIQVTKASPGTSAVTRTTSFTPNYATCVETTKVTEPSSSSYKVTESFGFDGFGNISSDTVTGATGTASPATRSTAISWGTTGQFAMSVTDPSGAQTTYNYNFGLGKVSSVTDPNGLTTAATFDDFGRPSESTGPDGTATQWTYNTCSTENDCGPLISMTTVQSQLDNTGATIRSDSVNQDWLGRPHQTWVETLNTSSSTVNSMVETLYDALGRVVQKSMPCLTGSCGTLSFTSTTYDVLNRPTQISRPVSSTNSAAQTTSFAYAGDTTTTTDPLGNSTVKIMTPVGTMGESKDANGYYQSFTYDGFGSLLSVTDSESSTLFSATYAYGLAAFQTAMSDMDLGAWGRTYDALGELTAWTDAKHQSFNGTYDALSRPLTRSEPDLYTQWTYGSPATASSFNVGRLASVCTGTGSSPSNCTASPGYAESEGYDSLGRLSTRVITMPQGGGTGTFTYSWGYNGTTGLLSTLTYPQSTSGYALQLQYGYSNGIVSSITDASDSPNVAIWTANAQNQFGQITQETLGNGVVTNRTYDAVTDWLSSIQAGVGSGSGVQNQSFLYDEMGDVTQRQDGNLGLSENFYYDNDYRLSSSTLTANGETSTNLSITYDNNGNITSRSDVNSGASWTYSSTARHQVTQAGSSSYNYVYDANGNATTRLGNPVIWTSYNYLSSISNAAGTSLAESVTFAYGPNRSRWQQIYTNPGGTETTNYIGGLMEEVSSGGVNTFKYYVNAGSRPVAVYSRTSTAVNTWSYFDLDHQGTIHSIDTGSGSISQYESYSAFGSRRSGTTWSGAESLSNQATAASITRQGYTFQTQLGLFMQLNHMNGRVQDALAGRFLSPDRRVPNPANTQDFNHYSYANNNPVSKVDPSGFDDQMQENEDDDDDDDGYTSGDCTGTRLCGGGMDSTSSPITSYYPNGMPSAGDSGDPSSATGLNGSGGLGNYTYPSGTDDYSPGLDDGGDGCTVPFACTGDSNSSPMSFDSDPSQIPGFGPGYAPATIGFDPDSPGSADELPGILVTTDRPAQYAPLQMPNSLIFNYGIYPWLRSIDCMIYAGSSSQCSWGGVAESAIPFVTAGLGGLASGPIAEAVGPFANQAATIFGNTASKAGVAALATFMMKAGPEIGVNVAKDLGMKTIEEVLDTRPVQIWDLVTEEREAANASFVEAVESTTPTIH